MRWGVSALAAVVALGTCGQLAAQQPVAPKAAAAGPAPTADQIAGWVRQLDADEFLTRETAMLQLLETGPAVLPALQPVLSGGSLESTSRGLYLLRQFALAADFESQDQAGRLLEELAERKETPALARRAAATLDELHQQRKSRALAELEGLGAKVVRSQFLTGLPLDEAVLSIEFGNGFRGQEVDLRRLKWLHEVPILILAGRQVADGWIKHAATMPNLQDIHLYQAGITDAGLAPLAEHKSIAQIGIYYTAVGDRVLEPLGKLPLLSFIKLFGTDATAQGVEAFKAVSGLHKIDRRRGAFLGIGSLPVDGTCLISNVHPNSPAEKGGLAREDVIIRFGEDKVTSFEKLTALIGERGVDEEVEIEVVRRTLDDQGNQVQRNVVTKVKLVPWEMELAVNNGPRP